jgi:hypothetical protein
MVPTIDISRATVTELLTLTEMLIDVLVEHGDVDPTETDINITVNKEGQDPRIVARVTAQAIMDRIRTTIDETA